MEANGVNYYKGVLLCSRPNESPSIQKEKPFCARVTPYDSLGLVPTKKFDQPQTRKRALPVLSNHKKWLKSFKQKVDKQKIQQQQQRQRDIRKLQKIKEEGVRTREQLKNSQFRSAANDTEKNIKQTEQVNQATRMKKGKKPAWAKTDQQIDDQQQKQVDQLIDFFEHAQVKDYLDDEQVKKMVEDLKSRIEDMKNTGNETQQGNWKKKQAQRIKQSQQNPANIANNDNNNKDDIMSRISKQSGGQSIASSKAAQRVQQLQNKKQKQKQWDKYTVSNSEKRSNIDEQIAKNVADQVLRNYPALKHHSNQSIRKLLEKQAHQQIKA